MTPPTGPQVSVVIPILNEAAALPALLEDLRNQTEAPGEVIVVDGGSTDSSCELVEEAARTDSRLRLIRCTGATPGRGRNVGIDAARHDWIALTDGGIRLSPDWLEQLSRAASAHPGCRVVYGSYRPREANAWQSAGSCVYVHPPAERVPGMPAMRGPFVASSLMHRAAWSQVGGFPDLRAAEDLIFFEAVERAGLPVAWAPLAVVEWDGPATPDAIFRRFLVFSRHNAWAGRARAYHYGVFRFYCVAAVLTGAVAWGSPPAALLVLPGMWLLRWGKCVISRARERSDAPSVWLRVPLVQLLIDLATVLGWFQAQVRRPFPARGSREVKERGE